MRLPYPEDDEELARQFATQAPSFSQESLYVPVPGTDLPAPPPANALPATDLASLRAAGDLQTLPGDPQKPVEVQRLPGDPRKPAEVQLLSRPSQTPEDRAMYGSGTPPWRDQPETPPAPAVAPRGAEPLQAGPVGSMPEYAPYDAPPDYSRRRMTPEELSRMSRGFQAIATPPIRPRLPEQKPPAYLTAAEMGPSPALNRPPMVGGDVHSYGATGAGRAGGGGGMSDWAVLGPLALLGLAGGEGGQALASGALSGYAGEQERQRREAREDAIRREGRQMTPYQQAQLGLQGRRVDMEQARLFADANRGLSPRDQLAREQWEWKKAHPEQMSDIERRKAESEIKKNEAMAARYARRGGGGGGGAAFDVTGALEAADKSYTEKNLQMPPHIKNKYLRARNRKDLDAAERLVQTDLQQQRQASARAAKEPVGTIIPGLNVTDQETFDSLSKKEREDLRKAVAGNKSMRTGLRRMIALRREYGSEIMSEAAGEYEAAQTLVIGGLTKLAESGVLNSGEFDRYKAMLPSLTPGPTDAVRVATLGAVDPTLNKITGFERTVGTLADARLAPFGVRFGEGKARTSAATSSDDDEWETIE